MSLSVYLAFLLACIVIVIVPGPAVTLVVANSMRHGRRAGLLNVAGIQVGLVVMVGVVLLGLSSLVAAMGEWFTWVRLAGAAYLVWLGWKLLTASGDLDAGSAPRKPRGGFFLQGFVVSLSNPKTLLFFGAFFPQFIDPARGFTVQVLIMGATSMVRRTVRQLVRAARFARGCVAVAPACPLDEPRERRDVDRRRPVARAVALKMIAARD